MDARQCCPESALSEFHKCPGSFTPVCASAVLRQMQNTSVIVAIFGAVS